MSFCTLCPEVHSNAVALCGLYSGSLDTYLRDHPHLKSIKLLLDACWQTWAGRCRPCQQIRNCDMGRPRREARRPESVGLPETQFPACEGTQTPGAGPNLRAAGRRAAFPWAARHTDLPDLLSSLGFTLKRIGSYYTTAEMDSIRIKGRYANTRRWSEFAGGRTKGGFSLGGGGLGRGTGLSRSGEGIPKRSALPGCFCFRPDWR